MVPSVDVCRSHKVLIVVFTCATRENKLLWFIFLKPFHYFSHTRSFINHQIKGSESEEVRLFFLFGFKILLTILRSQPENKFASHFFSLFCFY